MLATLTPRTKFEPKHTLALNIIYITSCTMLQEKYEADLCVIITSRFFIGGFYVCHAKSTNKAD